MRSISLQGESLSADTSGIDAFKHDLTSLMGKALSQLFNADETGLWWRCMPSKTLVHGETHANFFFKLRTE